MNPVPIVKLVGCGDERDLEEEFHLPWLYIVKLVGCGDERNGIDRE
jgi:hypothetical protein